MGREYFCAFHSYREKTAALTDEQFGRLMRAALLYSETGEITPLDPVEEMAFGFIRFDIDARAKSYDEKCEKARNSAKVRYDSLRTDANGCERMHTETESKSETETEKGEGTSPPAPSPAKKKQLNRFTPPTVEEVRAYCAERGNGIDAQRFVDYYSAQGWKMSNGQPMKDWKAAVRNWEGHDRADRSEGKASLSSANNPNKIVMPF